MRIKMLKMKRLENEWTLEKVQKMTGIDKSALSRIERGTEVCWPAWSKKLADLYGVPAEDLLRDVVVQLVEVKDRE